MKVTRDGFIWLTVDTDKAIEIWKKQVFNLYILYDDDSEALIEAEAQLANAIVRRLRIGIEVGKLVDGWVRKDAASEAHRKSCPMTGCVDCLFGVCRTDCEYQKEFMDKLEKSE